MVAADASHREGGDLSARDKRKLDSLHLATQHVYRNAESGLHAETTQAAIDELSSQVTSLQVTAPPEALVPVKKTTVSYTAGAGDLFVLVDATSTDVTISLPTPTVGRIYIIKRIDNSGNSASIDTTGPAKIDWADSQPLFYLNSITVGSDGVDWFIQ